MLSKFLKMSIVETTGPSNYTTGGFDVQVGELTIVEHAIVQLGGGYIGEVAGKNGNTITIKAYTSAGTEVTDGTDLSSVNVTIIAFGH